MLVIFKVVIYHMTVKLRALYSESLVIHLSNNWPLHQPTCPS